MSKYINDCNKTCSHILPIIKQGYKFLLNIDLLPEKKYFCQIQQIELIELGPGP